MSCRLSVVSRSFTQSTIGSASTSTPLTLPSNTQPPTPHLTLADHTTRYTS